MIWRAGYLSCRWACRPGGSDDRGEGRPFGGGLLVVDLFERVGEIFWGDKPVHCAIK